MIQRTFEVSDTGVAADEYGKKTVKAGTVYPANDATAKGIVFEDVDVTYGSRPASVIIAGRIFENRLHTKPETAAKTALEKQGIYFDTATEITR
nr:MAG TPA: Head decoration protein [Caudoviricetes sp.]